MASAPSTCHCQTGPKPHLGAVLQDDRPGLAIIRRAVVRLDRQVRRLEAPTQARPGCPAQVPDRLVAVLPGLHHPGVAVVMETELPHHVRPGMELGSKRESQVQVSVEQIDSVRPSRAKHRSPGCRIAPAARWVNGTGDPGPAGPENKHDETEKHESMSNVCGPLYTSRCPRLDRNSVSRMDGPETVRKCQARLGSTFPRLDSIRDTVTLYGLGATSRHGCGHRAGGARTSVRSSTPAIRCAGPPRGPGAVPLRRGRCGLKPALPRGESGPA